MTLTPQQFIQRWQNTTLGERQSYQIHFLDLCDLLGDEKPSGEGLDSAGRASPTRISPTAPRCSSCCATCSKRRNGCTPTATRRK